MRFLTSLALVGLSTQPVWASNDRATLDIPPYVLEYAPLVWLHSQETYMPSDIQQQLDHTRPNVNWTAIEGVQSPLNLNNLDTLNSMGNTSVYLTSLEGIEADPEPTWFRGIKPDSQGRTGDGTGSVIITTDRGNGTIDAFYFYFYAYNKGSKVLGMEFGDHIGDWEHNMIRFVNGEPKEIWYSQHASGQAFTYAAVEKKDKRPYVYSARGTHANYAIAGTHDHAIPGFNLPAGFLMDYTDRGILWDPVLNAYTYTYDKTTAAFEAVNSEDPVVWLDFNGKWGDDQPPNEPEIFGEAKNVGGPNGPKFKGLDRQKVCPSKSCFVLPIRTFSVKAS
ncbi:Vacuolar protein sorting-associated protein 62 [Penicillium robsamsonii]|uniref:Vacuolar protein sorting-associated protein 62 n=1 Tax=Penicillium robsamsonii TaxID=1792511 RepID=UPI0025499240|nr:Vacuolar protein sorting-associated protein 62 [Penicillium robsamsonii]KAJ5816362.1 Vacuolar protein sorting-associated protein 62 [Penicillium robsamsonii]